MAKDVLYKLLESKEAATKTLFRFCRKEEDLNKWIDFLKIYAVPENLAKTGQIEEMSKSGELEKLLDEVKKSVELLLEEEVKNISSQNNLIGLA